MNTHSSSRILARVKSWFTVFGPQSALFLRWLDVFCFPALWHRLYPSKVWSFNVWKTSSWSQKGDQGQLAYANCQALSLIPVWCWAGVSNQDSPTTFSISGQVLQPCLFLWGHVLQVQKNLKVFLPAPNYYTLVRVEPFSFLTGLKTRLWRTEVQCAQWIVLLFNIIPIVQLTKCLSRKKKISKLHKTVLHCENDMI